MKLRKAYFLTLLLPMLWLNGFAQSSGAIALQYRMRSPQVKTAKPPLIILLHGIGSNEDDLFALAEHLPASFLVISARAPYTMGANSFGWFKVDFSTGKPVYDSEQEKQSRGLILQFIDQLKRKHNFDTSNVFLLGFSQGAIMSYTVALTHPEKIKGIAVMSGRLPEQIKPIMPQQSKFKHLKVFMSHGTEDEVLQINYAREALTFLKTKQVPVTYKEYHAGHTITKEMLSDVINWLSR